MPFKHQGLALCASAFLWTTPSALAQQAPTLADPSTATQRAAEPQVRSIQYADWYYRCVDVKTADSATVPNCEVAQVSQVKQGEKDISVLTLAIAKTAPDLAKKKQAPELLLTALVPLNVYLPSGLLIDADGKSVAQINYRNCNEAGCWAQQKLDTKVVTALQKGTDGGGRLRLMNGQNINIKFSLKGLCNRVWRRLARMANPLNCIICCRHRMGRLQRLRERSTRRMARS
ncbi:invasion associated locus B family protein [Phyllobacterium zundukense]|jgi:invasion protein IalB|uniref:Invasion associated locus B family protein n=1 Tax=Phyllobacterium zundukense TaxID=1867719 RepID=A0ACD4D045_9HYPH|nr:invasion associated locus B family protein [Phyllobacterium zundukense]UXN59256.1 invasion associated locus B family protein [Phyllobacterium zundukense]